MLYQKWITKYRPTTLDGYVMSNSDLKQTVQEIIKDKTPKNLLFSGHPGTGKTALAYVLKNELGVSDLDFLKKNSSDENSVDMFRDEIKTFVESSTFDSPFKIVFLDEADGLSNSAQKVMRGFVDEHNDRVMFIMTCNYPHKITEPLRESRFREYKFNSLDKEEAVKFLVSILQNENIEYDTDTVMDYVNEYYPDMRALIDRAEEGSVTGTLTLKKTSNFFEDVKTLIHHDFHKTNNWTAIRDLLCEEINSHEGWESFFRFMYEEVIPTHPKMTEEQKKFAYLTTGEYLFRLNFMRACPELTAINFIIALGE